MVLVPSLLHTGTPEKGCLLLSHLNETVTVSASLESPRENRRLFPDLVAEKDLFRCVSFTIPRISSSSEVAFFTVHIKGQTQDFRKKSRVLVKNDQSLVFVQTDKPIYKPGQTELIQGSYKVVVEKESGGNIQHPFTVEEFVVPKFEVKVQVPKIISILDEKVDISVCGIYTYGKPVPGRATVRMCRKLFDSFYCPKKEFCEEFSHQLNSNGCITQQVNTNSLQLKNAGYEMELRVEATIREEGTDLEFTGSGTSKITNIATRVEFVKVDSHFRRGIPFFGQVLLVDGKNVPIPNKLVFISAFEANYLFNATTNEQGLAQFSIDTTSMLTNHLFITAYHEKGDMCYRIAFLEEEHRAAQHTARHVFSLSGSFIDLEPVVGTLPCDQTQTIRAHYILKVPAPGKLKEFVFYYLVDLSFNPAISPPASQAHLRVTASPQSLCALRAVDQSVHLLRPEAELSPSSVYNLLPVKDLTYFPENLDQEEEGQANCRYTRSTPPIGGSFSIPSVNYYINYDEEDMYSFLKVNSLLLTKVLAYESFGGAGMLYSPPIGAAAAEPGNNMPSPEPVSETVRSYFPETWIWELAMVDSSGVAEVGVTVPDTITEWKAGAFCLSNDTGLGFSLPTTLRAFQPFFVELTMPYSVIRGEAFTLKATVLNYLPNCIRVSVQLQASTAFLAAQNEKGKESYCICENERQTLSWEITPKTLGNMNFSVSAQAVKSLELCGNKVAEVPEIGRKDTVIKTLLVEPEGIEQEKTFNSMACTSGDILGSAMQNTQNLLQMPYGCGEQNMVLFAPNIYVLNYLSETQQLTSEIKSKAIAYLVSGYQRQLNYKHQDGSYSAFGDQSGRNEGNTWLTAFVLQTFAQAKSYIFIDEAHITQALDWLSQRQKENGCFRNSGSLLNNAIKGGVEDEVTLSVYITIALLESGLPVTNSVVQMALLCLESAWNTAQEGPLGSHIYTKALLAYAFALAGNKNRRGEILSSLDEEAVKEDNTVHWERPQKTRAPEGYFYQPQAPSAEVEMTSYVLLAYLTAQPAPSLEDLTSALHIVKWIIKQQNSYGGFSSTQDTVIALHALSKYGAATFIRTQKTAQVTIRDSKTFSTKLQVDSNNLLLLQQVSLPEIPGEYTITVTGERCVYLQTSMKYNILPEKEDSPFALEVQTLPQTCDGPKAHTSFQISVNVSYRGSRPVSNMVIVDVKMVSGFIPLKPTVKMLERSNHVSRTEVNNNHVIIYVEQVTAQTLSFSFTVLQDIPVRDLKPAIVKVYDYYETRESAIAEYTAPCSIGKKSHAMINIILH
ncbi:Alpha-2-macroglobulin [Myotis davidii]|uniref:Alpha-2-macroglobulin n=1 Tax=Myotis davidii TaxID=225400 RepID=L5MK20_MYODS|nr:Alpha-2-macroglobulin [Myotis davidii]